MAIKFSFKRGDLEYTITVSDEIYEYGEEEEEEEEEDEDSIVSTSKNSCITCRRVFRTPAGLRQHQTLMDHK